MLYDWLEKVTFAHPAAFALGLVIPLLVILYRRGRLGRQATVNVSTIRSFTVDSWRVRARHLPFMLRLLALAAIIVALAQPQRRHDEQRMEGEGIDIVLCMDVSGSMGSRDIPPSRMEVAKDVAEEFVRERPVDRIGLVIFSGESFTQCPLTTDRQTLITQIQALDSRKFLKDGTVIGEGLATSVDRLTESGSPSRVVILITDGKEDAPETRLIDPITALEIAKAENVKVYTIGMGAVSMTTRNFGNLPGNPQIDFIDEALLKRIAGETGGKYFRARDRQALQDIYQEINRLEKSKVEIVSFQRFEELFLPFVLAAIGLLFLELVLRMMVLRKFP